MQENPLIGKVITGVFITKGKHQIKFDIEGGEPIIARADADCCSHTWIEEIQGVEQIIGSPIVRAEEVDAPTVGGPAGEYGDVTVHYAFKITSGKGYALIDYRNESNGYYGGSLVWPGEHYYGGVYDQNGDKGEESEWEEVK